MWGCAAHRRDGSRLLFLTWQSRQGIKGLLADANAPSLAAGWVKELHERRIRLLIDSAACERGRIEERHSEQQHTKATCYAGDMR